jgi:hypothetical protein
MSSRPSPETEEREALLTQIIEGQGFNDIPSGKRTDSIIPSLSLTDNDRLRAHCQKPLRSQIHREARLLTILDISRWISEVLSVEAKVGVPATGLEDEKRAQLRNCVWVRQILRFGGEASRSAGNGFGLGKRCERE